MNGAQVLFTNYSLVKPTIISFDEEKSITLATLMSADYMTGVYYPQLYSINLDNNEFVKEFDGYNDQQINQLSAVQLTSIEDPVFTYNKLTKTYNMSFIGRSINYSNIVVNSINILDLDLKDRVTGVYSIIPNKQA